MNRLAIVDQGADDSFDHRLEVTTHNLETSM